MQNSTYTHVHQFISDVRLIFENCRRYNANDERLLIRMAGDFLEQVANRLVCHWIKQQPRIKHRPQRSILPGLGLLDDDLCMVRCECMQLRLPLPMHAVSSKGI